MAATEGDLFIRNISYLVTCDDRDRVLQNASVLVRDGVICRIFENSTSPDQPGAGNCSSTQPGAENCSPTQPSAENCSSDQLSAGNYSPDQTGTGNCSSDQPSTGNYSHAHLGTADLSGIQTIDASGCVLYPGLVNTHHHFYQIFSRNLPEVQNLELFPWLKALYQIWKNLNADVVHYSSLCGMGELLKSGCTTSSDHHYVFPAGCGLDLIDAQFAAADKLGMRFHATRGSMDLSEKDGGLPPDSVVQTVDEILRDSEEAVRKYHDSAPFAMHRVALAPCSPFSVSRELLVESAKLARALGVRLHTHLAETRDEERYMLEKEGIRPLTYMEQVGWIGNDVWYAHGIHFNDDELTLLAQTGTGVAHCPVSNMKLSSGIARVPEMLKSGVPVGLAVDGSASNDGSNLLEEIRAAYLLHRLNSSSAAPSGYDILKMATRGSAQLLGRNDIGQIAEGCAADFFLISLRRPELVGARYDPACMLATVGFKGAVDLTVVNGKIVVQDGRLVGIDEREAADQADAVCRKYLSR